MRKRFLSLLIALNLFVLPLTAVAQRAPAKPRPIPASVLAARGVDVINQAQLRTYLSFIASDEMEGRDTPSRGLDTTAKFLAVNLERWGFKPAGDDGTFFQKIALRRDAIDGPKSSVEIQGRKFAFGADFVPNAVRAEFAGPAVFAGNGWVIKAKNLNPYEGIDVKDKIIVVVGQPFPGLPRGIARADLTGRQGFDWSSPGIYAQQHGAKGVLAIADPQTLQNWEQVRARAAQGGRLVVEKFNTQPQQQNAPGVSTVTMSANMASALFEGETVDAATIVSKYNSGESIPSFELSSGKQVKVNVTVKNERPMTQNVVAIWEGSDAVLKNEYVAVGAHYDHVGTCAPAATDPICNGADDDGSGTTAMLAMAEALAKARQRPKRSVLFVWHCGEEKGLWGSRYFAENPTVPLDKIVTQLNMDMIGRSKKDGDTNPRNQTLSGPNTVYVIGSKMMSTELGELSERINASYLNLQLDYKYDDPADPNRFFFRSDHINYARKGIPIIFYFDGVHEDYHRPGDEPQKIDYEKFQKIARTVYVMLWEIAMRPNRPKVDKPLPAQLGRRAGIEETLKL